MLAQSNKQIENAIREIREEQAEKEATKKIRAELEQFKQDVDEGTWKKPGKRSSGILSDEDFQKKVAQIQARKQRHEQRKKDKQAEEQQAAKVLRDTLGKRHQDAKREIVVGDAVRMRGIQSQGRVEALDGNTATVIFGDMRTKVPLNRLILTDNSASTENSDRPKTKMDELKEGLKQYGISRMTQETIDDHRKNFHQDLDVRGMRGDEALQAVRYFIDDAILMGMPRVRILHGKGNGILRQLIRQYLSAEPNVSHFADENVQFGGAGITVVDF